MFHAIFLRASRLVFFCFWRFCSALLCFALLCWRRFIRRSSFQEEDGSHGPMAARCFPSLSRPICLVSAYYGPNEARALLLLSLDSRRFLGVFSSDKSCFRGFSGITAKTFGVWFGGSERRLFPFRGFVRFLSRPPNHPFYGGARRQRQRQRRR